MKRLIYFFTWIFLGCQNLDSVEDYRVVDNPGNSLIYPSEKWSCTYPENFGFSTRKLNEVRKYFDKIDGEALLVVKNGYAIVSWGDVTKPIDNRSIRKSYLNSLLGLEYGNGNLKLEMTLEDLEIDDKESLTSNEKKATIQDLLSSCSGVFHKANYESSEQKGARPPRGTFNSGSFFYYGNWDFNTLGHIYSTISGEDIFESFEKHIAIPLKMEDFSIHNCEYKRGKESNFPAYLFKSSARDDARFGYLYLRNGSWNGKQLVPQNWVELSTTTKVDTSKYYYYDYGFLWWVNTQKDRYFARGNSGQYIAVLPNENMVFVFRADPGSILNKWLGRRVKPSESFALIDMILNCKIS